MAENKNSSAIRVCKWEFKNVIIQNIADQKRFLSDEIDVFYGEISTTWKLDVTFNATKDISVYINKIVGPSNGFTVRFSAKLFEKNGKDRLHSFDEPGEKFLGSGWGWKSFIKLTENYIINGSLTFEFKIELVENAKIVPETSAADKLENHLTKFQHLLNSKDFSDLTFICSDGVSVSAHLAIVASCSPYVKHMIEGIKSKRKFHTIHEGDNDGETMMEILRYIYTLKVENLENLSTKLLQGAGKYELPGLKNRCVDFMIESMSVDNAVDYFTLGKRLGINSLLINSIDFIKSKFSVIRRHESWNKLDRELLLFLMDRVENFELKFCTTI